MEKKLLKKFLLKEEGTLLDFKATFYEIKNKQSKLDFVKDMLSFANSSILEDAYIICGVKQHITGKKDFPGVHEKTVTDDANWVQTLKSFSSHPINFCIEKIYLSEYNSTFIIVEISKDQIRPIICTKDEGDFLKQGVIYFRNGSNNDIAKDLVTVERILSKSFTLTSEETIKTDPTYNKYSKFPPAPYYKFLGRENEISLIYDELINHHKNYLLALNGEGGIGKTSIAHRVATQIKENILNGTAELDEVIWISAKDQRIYFDERRKLDREFFTLEDLYNKILLVFYDTNIIDSLTMDKKKKYVDEAMASSKFLIILDNLEVFENTTLSEIHKFIKNTPLGHKFLLTSRHDLRVQEFIAIEKFGFDFSKIYIEEILNSLAPSRKEEISPKIQFKSKEFYELTNGNPLYINFFISQIIKGKEIDDILDRRNIEGEKPLKAYCFDSTLQIMTEDELKVMYSLAVTETNYLNFLELRYMTNLKHSELENILEGLQTYSMIYREYRDGTIIYSLNNLLHVYLNEDRRIPGAEYNRLFQKSRTISNYDKSISSGFSFNFGLDSLKNKNEKMSYNMILEIFDSKSEVTDKYLEEIVALYPGNYLVPFYKHYNSIQSNAQSQYTIYSQINNDFADILSQNKSLEQYPLIIFWKSILYLMIEKYDDIIRDCEALLKGEIENAKPLIHMLLGVAYNLNALEAYKYQRYQDHDEYRDLSYDNFKQGIEEFKLAPYFYFIKRYFIYCYNQNNKHLKNQVIEIKDYKPYFSDCIIFNVKDIFAPKQLQR